MCSSVLQAADNRNTDPQRNLLQHKLIRVAGGESAIHLRRKSNIDRMTCALARRRPSTRSTLFSGLRWLTGIGTERGVTWPDKAPLWVMAYFATARARTSYSLNR